MFSRVMHHSQRPQQLDFTAYHGFQPDPSMLPYEESSRRLSDYGNRADQAGALGSSQNVNALQNHNSAANIDEQGVYTRPSVHEHMLRRKTPSGTLAAAYDGRAFEWWNGPPASKMQRPGRLPSRPVLNGKWVSPEVLDGTGVALDHPPLVQTPAYSRYNSMHVPTVLQPTYQPVGPTASNGSSNLYGPYWPDGHREPYRPAVSSSLGHHNADNVTPRSERPFYTPVSHSQQMSVLFGSEAGFSEIQTVGNIGNQYNQYPGPYNLMSAQPNASVAGWHVKNTPFPVYGIGSGLGGRNQNIQFKDKVLQRSQNAYIDLLAFLRRSKGFRTNRRSHPRSLSQPNNHLKPPAQSTQFNSNTQQRLPPRRSSHSYYFDRHARDYTFYREPSSNRSHSHNLVSDIHDRSLAEMHASHDKSHDSRSPQIRVDDNGRNLSSLPGSDALENAKSALEMLTSLCQESGWSWIDGMLLAGCLAYGLEDYNTAVFWYSNIVELDSSHVEALSNLAASLLALNRREEAEQHWLRSVKLRPWYFEAVEHLLGLLCEDHRANEAVNIIDFVERSLRIIKPDRDQVSDTSSDECQSSASSTCTPLLEQPIFDFESDQHARGRLLGNDFEEHNTQSGFGSSGYAIAGSENGRMLALVHAKGSLLYALGDAYGASQAFENAVLIAAGKRFHGIKDLIRKILRVLSNGSNINGSTGLQKNSWIQGQGIPPLLLPPDKALKTASLVFAREGELPGMRHIPEGLAKRAAISTMSNSLLSLAKIYQDGLSNTTSSARSAQTPSSIRDILALYYLSLSLQPSPSTANNVGILLASVQQPASAQTARVRSDPSIPSIPGVTPGSGIALALSYYNYGLNLDSRHAHLFTNLGSLLKDIGQLAAAVKMYEQAVACDGTFDIALANLANAVKDQGRIGEAIQYYRRAVASSPDFAEAVCGLSNALNSVCDWTGRGGVILENGRYDRWHVDEEGLLCDSRGHTEGSGWMNRVVDIVGRQLGEGAQWGHGVLGEQTCRSLVRDLELVNSGVTSVDGEAARLLAKLRSWTGTAWEGARLVQFVERAIKVAMRQWYLDRFVRRKELPPSAYPRFALPSALSVPAAPTVLPFHTFTCPLTAKDIRMISQRNALRISCSTLHSQWLPNTIYPPPPPPNPCLNIGYVSSDFNNHPLAHLMQSVFGFHNPLKVKAFCYATTASDQSVHRQKIEHEAPVFLDASSWSSERLVQQIVKDKIHILVNLNGYTRGAKNEVFAARPAPVQMSFMGFAGTLGAEWCDYLLADKIAVPPETLRPGRSNVSLEDLVYDEQSSINDQWVYSENIIFCRDTFFCCDHRQSSGDDQLPWPEEQQRRWRMRKELFPSLSDDAIIFGNFNQLYKIEPTTFRTWLRILAKVPKAILWLLRFPDLGESNLKRTARLWAGDEIASRIWFTDVAPKGQHISRARICDLFLDTPECNAHTTAADILWSSTPLLTYPKYKYKMCSRMAASILTSALPSTLEGKEAAHELIASDEDQYEESAVSLANGLSYNSIGIGTGRLLDIRKSLYEHRWSSALFDTQRWVCDVEEAYHEAWRRWVHGIGGDIYL